MSEHSLEILAATESIFVILGLIASISYWAWVGYRRVFRHVSLSERDGGLFRWYDLFLVLTFGLTIVIWVSQLELYYDHPDVLDAITQGYHIAFACLAVVAVLLASYLVIRLVDPWINKACGWIAGPS